METPADLSHLVIRDDDGKISDVDINLQRGSKEKNFFLLEKFPGWPLQ